MTANCLAAASSSQSASLEADPGARSAGDPTPVSGGYMEPQGLSSLGFERLNYRWIEGVGWALPAQTAGRYLRELAERHLRARVARDAGWRWRQVLQGCE